jgi:hypothetical protein
MGTIIVDAEYCPVTKLPFDAEAIELSLGSIDVLIDITWARWWQWNWRTGTGQRIRSRC